MASILKIDPMSADHIQILPAVNVLVEGGIVAGPTQTFYGLMAAADRPDALNRVFDIKGRDNRMPLLLLLDRTARAECYARELPESAMGLVERFWPGPLTLLLRAQQGLHESLVGPTRTIALRVEGLPVIRTLVRASDRAVSGTSANPSGKPPARTAGEVEEYFGDKVDLILDGGTCPGGLPSTIIDASLGPPRLVRDGGLSLNDMIAAAPGMRT